tara:strand:- start:2291 stop:3838 length:1548 start_codon:yes stop_codon:yes gene_type:complete
MADISNSTRDRNNILHLNSNTIVALKYVDVSASAFSNPDAGFFGYDADGVYREAGVATSSPTTGQPAKASWASEGEHTTATTTRGLEDPFPKRIFIILTSVEAVILNADDLAVWIRFTRATGSAHSDYHCLGGATTSFVDADFSEGVLSVVTTDASVPAMTGLVVIDFRRDQMFISKATANASISSKNIQNRNAAGVWTVSPGTLTAMGQLNAQINSVSMLTDKGITHVATSHPNGISLLKFRPGVNGYAASPSPHVLVKTSQLFSKAYTSTSYNAIDDYDGDATTPIFTADNSTQWASDNIRAGDAVSFGGASYRIQTVETSRLILSQEIPVAASGSSYSILRRVDRVLFHTLSSFFFVNGEGLVVQQQDVGWQSSNNAIDPFDTPDYQSSTGASTSAQALCVRSGKLYVATDVGVFAITLSDVSSGLPSTLDYSASSGDGVYTVLANNRATALAVDTDSGHLLVASYDGSSSSEVVEIAVDNLHQKVRSTTSTVEVNALIGYTNSSGPPTTPV